MLPDGKLWSYDGYLTYPSSAAAQAEIDEYEVEDVVVTPLYAEPPEVGELARALVEKLDVVHEDPAYKGVWGLHYVHGGRYTGPTYTDELGALRRALAQYEDKGA